MSARRTAPITDADHDRLFLAAYRAGGGDVIAAMQRRITKALDALEREEAHAADADREARATLAVFADGTMPGTERRP